MQTLNKRLFSESEAAYYLGLSKHTLRKQRSDGQRENRMPVVPYIQLGRTVKYLREELDAYIDFQISESRNTAMEV